MAVIIVTIIFVKIITTMVIVIIIIIIIILTCSGPHKTRGPDQDPLGSGKALSLQPGEGSMRLN